MPDESPRSATTELTVLRRWGPALLLLATVLVWGVRLEGRVDSGEEATDATVKRIDALETQSAALRMDMTKFQGSVDTLKVMIESVKESTSRIESKLDQIQTKKDNR